MNSRSPLYPRRPRPIIEREAPNTCLTFGKANQSCQHKPHHRLTKSRVASPPTHFQDQHSRPWAAAARDTATTAVRAPHESLASSTTWKRFSNNIKPRQPRKPSVDTDARDVPQLRLPPVFLESPTARPRRNNSAGAPTKARHTPNHQKKYQEAGHAAPCVVERSRRP